MRDGNAAKMRAYADKHQPLLALDAAAVARWIYGGSPVVGCGLGDLLGCAMRNEDRLSLPAHSDDLSRFIGRTRPWMRSRD